MIQEILGCYLIKKQLIQLESETSLIDSSSLMISGVIESNSKKLPFFLGKVQIKV